jgi:hypothetical protein
MNEDVKQAFKNVVHSHDGDLIRDYFDLKLRELLDVRKATAEDFISRGIAATFIEEEVLARFKVFDEKIEELGDDTFL